ncbi:MAG: hypothetical protein L6R39_001472 [Caloplaca ligustica]|nr:MAG: hypothetical protein L6R39_001472 [Caloplaca ligustica]
MEIRSGSHVNGRKHVAGRDGQKSSSKSIPALLPSVLQLQQILDNPIRFGPATRLTYEDEARMGSKGLKWSTASEHFVVLLHIPRFVNWLEQIHLNKKRKYCIANCVACAVANLSLAYWNVPQDPDQVEELLSNFDVSGKESPRDLFELEFKVIIKCSVCAKVNFLRETSNDLTITCEGHNNLDQAIRREFGSEKRHDIDCDSCGKRVTKEYTQRITRGPDILCTQFNRFIAHGNHSMKNPRNVPFGANLNLSPYVDNKSPLQYRLVAAIHHRGTLGAGHYISFTRTPGGNWKRQDDEKVTEATLEAAVRCGKGFTPYLLFWAKVQAKKTQIPTDPRKRTHGAVENTAQEGPDRRRSKCLKTGQPKSDSSKHEPNAQAMSSLPWPLSWLPRAPQVRAEEAFTMPTKTQNEG